MEIGERIRLRRIELGLTQEELAKKLGYTSKTTIAKIESNANKLRQTKIYEIAKALETTPSYIMGWEDEPISFEYQPEWEEQELLELWRNASEPIRQSVLILLKSEIK